jgi:hypothetical protein
VQTSVRPFSTWSASANQLRTYLAAQHPHPHVRTRSRQSRVDSPTTLPRIPRKTSVPQVSLLIRRCREPRYSGGGSEAASIPTWSSGNLLTERGVKMKVQMMVTASALCLLTAAGATYSQDAQQTPSAQMNQSARQQGAAPTGAGA